MSREKPKEVYITKVTKFGNGAKIKGFKHHIGCKVLITLFDKYYCGSCGDSYNTEILAKECCSIRKKKNLQIKSVIYGTEQFKQLTKDKEYFI